MSGTTTVKPQDHESYNTFTLITFLLPMVGLILGIVFLTRLDATEKKLGEHLIAFSVLASILWGFLYVVFMSDFFIL